jgi:hypothetical protein
VSNLRQHSFQVPELSSIRTWIDLELGKLFLESPRRKDKLQISVIENLTHLSAEADVYGQRYGCAIVYMFTLYKYDNICFQIHLFCHLLLYPIPHIVLLILMFLWVYLG